MACLNDCNFIGNVGKDPEIRSLQNGGKVANFSLACTEKWKNKAGEPQEKTEWITITVFNENIVTVVEKYVKKGSKLFVKGQFSTRKWQDKEGNDRYSTEIVLKPYRGEIVLLDSKGSDTKHGEGAYAPLDNTPKGRAVAPVDDYADEVPF